MFLNGKEGSAAQGPSDPEEFAKQGLFQAAGGSLDEVLSRLGFDTGGKPLGIDGGS